jgi:hypothetical protein
MAKKSTTSLSVADLEQMLKDAKNEIEQLQKERAGLETRAAEIDARLVELAGGKKRGGPTKGAKAEAPQPTAKPKGKKPGRKKMTLPQHVERVLKNAGNAMQIQEIADTLRKKGVSSANTLAMQVGQVIRKGQVAAQKIGRGVYKWAGGESAPAAPPEKATKKKTARKKAAKGAKKATKAPKK